VVAATPIGNVDDATPRLRHALESADVIAAEDTRRLRRLLAALEIHSRARIVSYHDHNEAQRVDDLLAEVRAGRSVVVVSDAGTPLVSDPGHRLVAAAAAAGLDVVALPGPSAVTSALVLSGFASDRWCFEGFLPRRGGERQRALAALSHEPRTMVFFEAPHRLAATLADMSSAFGGERAAVVCRELTKTYEEVRRAPLRDLAAWAADGVRGEITVVVAGAPSSDAAEIDDATLRQAVEEQLARGVTRRDAAAAVAASYGVARRRVYDLATRPSRSTQP
jgi:16S rRNA (cytidine1402-2'-O)-methyltransferase